MGVSDLQNYETKIELYFFKIYPVCGIALLETENVKRLAPGHVTATIQLFTNKVQLESVQRLRIEKGRARPKGRTSGKPQRPQ